ncbi:hypothetical protein ACIGWV_10080 [Streptomyces sp. NPDC055082]|uniref:hypothetical protein n=1 Tax=Streptomyces sp. NPDC055082 TaxID=3365718 RepID=UPI0037CFC0EE
MTGDITLELYKGSHTVVARHSPHSPHSRYSGSLATYETGDTFNHQAGAAFAYVWSLPLTRP